MDAMRGTISAKGPSWTPRWRAATWIALVAALWGGFAVGRGTASGIPAVARPDAAMHKQIKFVTTDSADPIRARHHHRVKWG